MSTDIVAAVPVVAEVAVKNPEMQKKNRIQVSNTKKPLFFYVNLAKVVSHYRFIFFVLLALRLVVEPPLFRFRGGSVYDPNHSSFKSFFL